MDKQTDRDKESEVEFGFCLPWKSQPKKESGWVGHSLREPPDRISRLGRQGAGGGPGPNEMGSHPVLESQELSSTVLLPVYFLACLFVCLLACLCLFACLSVCLSVCLPVCLFLCLSVCLFVCFLFVLHSVALSFHCVSVL